uniref:hypothetical protein n=1 Tax=Limnohabitans sp. TaxID=1907725 RepID=UPI0040475EAE
MNTQPLETTAPALDTAETDATVRRRRIARLSLIIAEAVGRWAEDPTPDRREGIISATKELLGYLEEGTK